MWRLLLILLSSVAMLAASPKVETLLAEAMEAEQALRTEEALNLYLQIESLRPDDAFVLQKIARHYSDSVVDTDDTDEKRQRASRALNYAQRAVALEPDNPVNVLSLAICHGTLGVYSDTATKVRYSRLVKAEAERALQLDPDYAFAHHVLGRWHYEVASLGKMSRWVVGLVYGGLPEASFKEAVSHLQRAVELEPEVLVHHLELGIALARAGNEPEARSRLNRGLSMPAVAKHDNAAKERARVVLAGL